MVRCLPLIEILEFVLLHKLPNSTQVSEEVFLTIGSVVNILDENFAKYVNEQLIDCLLAGMRNWQDYKSCLVCVGMVGDIARAIGKKIIPYCDAIVRVLLDDVRNVELDRSVKPAILSCFGDIAMSILGDFTRYTDYVFQILEQACGTVASTTITDVNDIDLIDYVCDFCMGIFEAYSGIIHGFSEHKDGVNMLFNQLNSIIPLILYIAHNKEILQNDALERNAIGCLGDLFQNLDKEKTKEYARNNLVRQFVEDCKSSNEDEIKKKIAYWVSELMTK